MFPYTFWKAILLGNDNKTTTEEHEEHEERQEKQKKTQIEQE